MGNKVIVGVHGIRSERGKVIVSLYREWGFKRFGAEPVMRLEVPAAEGSLQVVFDEVESGDWAAAAYHDENDNGVLDLTMVGTPSEGRGYSRVTHPGLRAPTFDEASFHLSDHALAIAIEIRYPS